MLWLQVTQAASRQKWRALAKAAGLDLKSGAFGLWHGVWDLMQFGARKSGKAGEAGSVRRGGTLATAGSAGGYYSGLTVLRGLDRLRLQNSQLTALRFWKLDIAKLAIPRTIEQLGSQASFPPEL